jgi:hypothetical protein
MRRCTSPGGRTINGLIDGLKNAYRIEDQYAASMIVAEVITRLRHAEDAWG